MYITERNGKYRAWERIVIDGKVKKISVTMEKNTAQSRKKAQEELNKKKIRPDTELRYDNLVELYITYQKSTLKASTWTRNEASLKRLSETFGNAKLSTMTAGFISSRLLQKTSNPGTYNEYLKRIKGMFRWAYRYDYIESSACVDKIQPLKEDMTDSQKVVDKYLETDELRTVLDATTPYYRNIFEFLALSGLRIGELIALEDADITETDIIVRKTYDNNNGIINTPKTPAGWRYVHIQPELMQCINRIRNQSRTYRIRTGTRMPYFVISPQGGRLSYAKTNRTFGALCVRLTGRKLTLHALRHTHVALMAEAGVDLDAISRRIGHQGTKITKEIYYHVTKKQQEKDNSAFDSVTIFA